MGYNTQNKTSSNLDAKYKKRIMVKTDIILEKKF